MGQVSFHFGLVIQGQFWRFKLAFHPNLCPSYRQRPTRQRLSARLQARMRPSSIQFRHCYLSHIPTSETRQVNTTLRGLVIRTYIMLILLHRHHPRDIVECHGSQPEVGIVIDGADFSHERIRVGCLDTVDVGDEIGCC